MRRLFPVSCLGATTVLAVSLLSAGHAFADGPPAARFDLQTAPTATPPPQWSAPPAAPPSYQRPPAPAPYPPAYPYAPSAGYVAPVPQPAPKTPSTLDDWSLGAGVSTSITDSATLGGAVVNGIVSPSTLSPRVSLEARLGPKTWLVLNAAFFSSTFNVPVTPVFGTNGDDSGIRNKIVETDTRVSALLGIRQVVVSSVVDVSVVAGLSVAHESLSGNTLRPGEAVPSVPGSNDNFFGAVGGFAVERELITSLAVRLSVDLLSLNTVWSNMATLNSNDGTVVHNHFSGWNAGLVLNPALYLQFYF